MHECSDTCTLSVQSHSRAVERQLVKDHHLTFQHDYSNTLFSLNVSTWILVILIEYLFTSYFQSSFHFMVSSYQKIIKENRYMYWHYTAGVGNAYTHSHMKEKNKDMHAFNAIALYNTRIK